LCSSFAAAKTQTIRRASLARSCLLSRIKNHHSDKKKECARRPLESENPSKSSWWTDELMNWWIHHLIVACVIKTSWSDTLFLVQEKERYDERASDGASDRCNISQCVMHWPQDKALHVLYRHDTTRMNRIESSLLSYQATSARTKKCIEAS
jgi:hypothetical protein